MKELEKPVREFYKARKTVFGRFPVLFLLLVTFGLVATLYGLERLIDGIPALSQNPFATLGVGLAILIFTGTLYKKLQ